MTLIDVVVLDDDAVSKVAVVSSDGDGHHLAAVREKVVRMKRHDHSGWVAGAGFKGARTFHPSSFLLVLRDTSQTPV